jgi:hypothetical protein
MIALGIHFQTDFRRFLSAIIQLVFTRLSPGEAAALFLSWSARLLFFPISFPDAQPLSKAVIPRINDLMNAAVS